MSHDLRISARTETQNKFKIEGGSKLEVFDEDGGKLYEGEFKSFTSNFLKLLYGSMIGAGTAKAKDLTNTDLPMDSFPQNTFNISGGAGVKKFGVVVGTNTAAVSVSDYNITVPSGLTFNATAVGASSIGADSISVEISRQISNTTGSTVNLKEAGLICGSEDEVDSNVLIARDLLDLTLENGKKSVWRYTINFNFANDVGGFVKNFADKMFNGILSEKTNNAQWAVRDQIGCVVFDNKIWVMGGSSNVGFYNDVWYSSDGVNWTQATSSAGWSKRTNFGCVVFDNKIWVMGGHLSGSYRRDVWYSSDGVNWTQATSSAGWAKRAGLGCVVFDNKIWVMGGSSNASFYNDVWYSSDGVNWTQATSSAGWAKRDEFGCLVWNGKICVMGGENSSWQAINDVWYSSDGVNWTQATSSAGWAGRSSFAFTYVSDSIICVITSSREIWYSSDAENWTLAASVILERKTVFLRGTYDAENIFYFPGRINDSNYCNDVWVIKRLNVNLIPGSSSSSFSPTATALGAVIANGSGSGQLVYGAMPGAGTTEPSVSGNKTKFSIAREFTNNSGSDIIVREVGLFSGSDMLARLILAQPVTIANGESEVISVDFETEV